MKLDTTDKRNILGILFGDFFGQGINFLVNLFIAIHFGAVVFGIVSNGNAIAACVAVVVACGIPSILSRNIVQQPHQTAELISTAIIIRIGAAIITNLLVVALVVTGDYSSTEQIAVVVLSLAATMSLFNLDQSFDAVGRSYPHAMIRLFAFNLMYLGLILLLFVLVPNANVIQVVSCLLIASLVFSGANVWYFHKYVQPLKPIFNVGIARDFLKDASPILLTTLLSAIYLNLAVLYLRHHSGLVVAADYSAASRIILILLMFDVAIMRVLVPKISGLQGSVGREHLVALLRIFGLRLAYLLPLTGLTMIFSESIIRIAFQDGYPNAAPTLFFLAIWLLPGALNHLGTYLYSHQGMAAYVQWTVIKLGLLLTLVFVFVQPTQALSFAQLLALVELLSVLLLVGLVIRHVRSRARPL